VVVVDVPLVVCVSADAVMRERLVRQLEACGPVLICTDLQELKAILFPEQPPIRPQPAAMDVAPLTVGDLVIDAASYRVTWRGLPLPLTRLERRLLGCLAGPPMDVWTYQRLFHSVWGAAYLGDTSILHSAVKRLRSKLRATGDQLSVETIRGVGYQLVASFDLR
jgi:DNA-binding response OmpR family regulator